MTVLPGETGIQWNPAGNPSIFLGFFTQLSAGAAPPPSLKLTPAAASEEEAPVGHTTIMLSSAVGSAAIGSAGACGLEKERFVFGIANGRSKGMNDYERL